MSSWHLLESDELKAAAHLVAVRSVSETEER